MSFGEKLAKLRKEKGMSQEELANELNISRQAVSKWESNNSYPETDKIIAICKLFNCSMDELIGLKETKNKNENGFFQKINNYFEEIVKGMKLFYSMTFKQKIKCLIELSFYVIALILFFIAVNEILFVAISQLLNILPLEILRHVLETLQGVFSLIYMIVIIYLAVKLYKERYLDYYDNLNKNYEEEQVVDVNHEKVKIKEEKIIIRDSNDDFKPFKIIKKLFSIFLKFCLAFLAFGLIVAFVVLVACTIFIIYFANNGIILVYISLALIGVLIAIYVIIEVIIKYIFNIKQKLKRLFIMFISSLIIMGISSGLFWCELSNYQIIRNNSLDSLIKEDIITMNDNLIINYLEDYETEIKIVDRSDILVQFYASEKDMMKVKSYNYKQKIDGIFNSKEYLVQDYYTNFLYDSKSFKEFTDEFLSYIKNKEIVVKDAHLKIVIYLSEANYNKLLDNEQTRDMFEE